MELKQLKYFTTIADAGSICEGARRLNISQPPLSYQMKLLEEELGTRLFDRGARKISLTESGRIFYQRAISILQMTDTTAREIENIRRHPVLRIGMTPTSGPRMMELLKQFADSDPQVRFEIREGSTFQLLEHLDRQTIDITTVRTPVNLVHLESRPMAREPMVAAGKANFFQRSDVIQNTEQSGQEGHLGERITLEEVAGLPLIIYRRYDELIRSTMKEAGLGIDVICECDDARMAMMLADSGLGVAVFPDSMRRLCKGLQVREIACERLETEILLVWRDDRSVPEVVERLLLQLP